jgi:polyisoprenoid-binding protein YceI
MVRIALCATLLIVLSAIPALAADVTGTWTIETKDPRNGNDIKATYVFKQEGAKLTGTIDISGGHDETSSLHGKIDGNNISFTDATYTPGRHD